MLIKKIAFSFSLMFFMTMACRHGNTPNAQNDDPQEEEVFGGKFYLRAIPNVGRVPVYSYYFLYVMKNGTQAYSSMNIDQLDADGFGEDQIKDFLRADREREDYLEFKSIEDVETFVNSIKTRTQNYYPVALNPQGEGESEVEIINALLSHMRRGTGVRDRQIQYEGEILFTNINKLTFSRQVAPLANPLSQGCYEQSITNFFNEVVVPDRASDPER